MDEEAPYTDEQVQDIAEKMAKSIRETPPFLVSTVVKHYEGPLWLLKFYSQKHNPLGSFPFEPETLTMKQKAIIAKIVGESMKHLGRDHSDYKFKPVKPSGRGNVDRRDWDLEQRMKNRRNHEF